VTEAAAQPLGHGGQRERIMKGLMAFVASLVFSLGIAGSALPQTPAQTPAPGQTEEKKMGEQMKSAACSGTPQLRGEDALGARR